MPRIPYILRLERDRLILELLKGGQLPVEDVAVIFNVSRQTVYDIIKFIKAPTKTVKARKDKNVQKRRSTD